MRIRRRRSSRSKSTAVRPGGAKKSSGETSKLVQAERVDEDTVTDYGDRVLEALKGGTEVLNSVSFYQVVRELGEGGMGSVFLAEHVSEGDIRKPVAIKVIKDTHDKRAIERFVEEARILAQLSQGTIVELLALESKEVLIRGGRDEANPDSHRSKLYFMVMEYINGPSFEHILKHHARDHFFVHPGMVGFILNKAAIALAEAHAAKDENGGPLNLVHRDISPSNILIASKFGIVKLADFGVAKAFGDFAEEGWSAKQKIVGKPAYMSPEQLEGQASSASDIWGLGVIGYEALTGYRPYRPIGRTLKEKVANLKRQFRYPLRRPTEVMQSSDKYFFMEAISEVIMQCLSIDPDQRPSAGELNQYLVSRFLFQRGVGPSNLSLAAYMRLLNRSAGDAEIIPPDGYEETDDARILCDTLHIDDPLQAFRPRRANQFQPDFVKAVRAKEPNPCLEHDEFGAFGLTEDGGGATEFL